MSSGIPKHILDVWDLDGPAVPLGNGLINDTYLVDGRYVLQRLNSSVFSNSLQVIDNYLKLFQVLEDFIPRPINNRDGEFFSVDRDGEVWRVNEYYDGSTVDDLSAQLAPAAGSAFGKFIRRLSGLDLRIAPVIQGFHDFDYYLTQFREATRNRPAAHEHEVIDELITHRRSFGSHRTLIHGDCKVNNLLFNKQKLRVVHVLDLDTVMWGHPAWDFGDLVRSLATSSTSTSWSWSDTHTRIQSVCEGFFSQVPISSYYHPSEFAYGPVHMSLMLGIRFLTDHYQGDVYFKTSSRGQNLRRAQSQLQLAKQFHEVQPLLVEEIERAASKSSSK